MKILITGYKGFIGSNFWKYYTEQGGNQLFGMDIKDGPALENDCRTFFRNDTSTDWDLVIHAAAIVGGRAFIEGEPLSVATDLSIDSEMFNWALKVKPKHVLYFSSSAAYPIRLQTKKHFLKESEIDIQDMRSADFTYGWCKLSGEYLASFARKAGVNVHVVRPFGGYGETQDMTYPFPSIVERTKRGDDPCEVWGTGKQTRDFIHIDDLIAAMVIMIERDIPGPVNLGTGRPMSFNKLAKLMYKVAGKKIPKIKNEIGKPMGVFYRVADTTEMAKFYIPKITLEEGIRRSLEHQRNYPIENQ